MTALENLLSQVPDWIVIAAAVVTAIGVIWQRTIKPFVHTMRRIESSLDYVAAEMHLNGGATARDAIKRIDEAVVGLDGRLRRIEANTTNERTTR